jgi:hypothetical protein
MLAPQNYSTDKPNLGCGGYSDMEHTLRIIG